MEAITVVIHGCETCCNQVKSPWQRGLWLGFDMAGPSNVLDCSGHSHEDGKVSTTYSPHWEQPPGMNWAEKLGVSQGIE